METHQKQLTLFALEENVREQLGQVFHGLHALRFTDRVKCISGLASSSHNQHYRTPEGRRTAPCTLLPIIFS